MILYKISCHSDCGTYFQAYLQSLSLFAESKEDAIQIARNWMAEQREYFIKKDESKWEFEELAKGITGPGGVFDYVIDSDY